MKHPQTFDCGGERIPSAVTDEGYTQASFLFVAAALLVWSTSNWHQRVVALMETATKETEAAHIPGVCGCGCQTDVAWWTNTLLLLIAKRIRCQKACNRRATDPLRAFLKASRAQVRWCFAEATNAV